MSERKPTRLEFTLLRLWHAWLAGSFPIAWITADEDTYAMHLFAGYAVLGAIVVRLLAALVAPARSPLRLQWPSLAVARTWLVERKGRHPLFAWFATALLLSVGFSAGSGALADGLPWLEDPHEALSEAALWVIFAHIAFVAAYFAGRRFVARLRALAAVAVAALALASPQAAMAGDPRREAMLADFASAARAAEPVFAGFSARRGAALFRSRPAAGDPRTPSCTSCHTDDPKAAGRNAKTGRPIDPVAVAVNPKRFTDRAEVDKHFARDCKSVLGRACTAREMGDYLTFMMEP